MEFYKSDTHRARWHVLLVPYSLPSQSSLGHILGSLRIQELGPAHSCNSREWPNYLPAVMKVKRAELASGGTWTALSRLTSKEITIQSQKKKVPTVNVLSSLEMRR